MDSFESSKIAGAVLIAALAIVMPKTLMQMWAEGAAHSGHAATGYTLPMPAGAVAAKGADTKAGKPGTPMQVAATDAAPAAGAPAAAGGSAAGGGIYDTVKPLLAAAKAEGGAATFKACAACHSGDKGGANKVGPALWGIVGRKTGGVDGFSYSEAMKGKGGDWTYDRLAGFLNNPKTYVAGTKMVYNGVQDPEKLADLLAYLGTLSDAPVPLPK
jgi:cytochrome c